MVDEDGNTKAIRLKMGQGSLLLITEPVLFSNLHLRRKEVKSIADVLFQGYKIGPILWETGIRPKLNKKQGAERSPEKSDEQHLESPLTYILSQKGLKESWYVLICTLLMFLGFYVRRRQRPMPVFYSHENQSVEEVKTLSNLYLNRPVNRELAEMKVLYLRYQLKKNFQMELLSFKREPERLSARTGVRLQLIKSLSEKLSLLQQKEELSEGFVRDLCLSVNQFYEEAGL